jgi:hypothetical protein
VAALPGKEERGGGCSSRWPAMGGSSRGAGEREEEGNPKLLIPCQGMQFLCMKGGYMANCTWASIWAIYTGHMGHTHIH